MAKKEIKRGRPSKYKEVYCKEIISFFDVPHTFEKEVKGIDKMGNPTIKFVERANPLPTFERFAFKIGVNLDTLLNWAKTYDEFGKSYIFCKYLQKEMLNDLSIRGFYNPTYAMFLAKNITDMKDKQEVENTNINVEPLKIEIVE